MDSFTRYVLSKINYYDVVCRKHKDVSDDVRKGYENIVDELLDVLAVYRDPVVDADDIESDMLDDLKIVNGN